MFPLYDFGFQSEILILFFQKKNTFFSSIFLDSKENTHASNEMIEFSKPDVPVAKTEPSKKIVSNTPTYQQRTISKLTTASPATVTTKRLMTSNNNATASASLAPSTLGVSTSNSKTHTVKSMPNSTPVSSVTSQIKARKTSTAGSSSNNTGLAAANIASNLTNKTLANKKLKTHQLNENEIPKALNLNNNKTGMNKVFFVCLNFEKRGNYDVFLAPLLLLFLVFGNGKEKKSSKLFSLLALARFFSLIEEKKTNFKCQSLNGK
jgi:hypothetical protein